MSSGAIVPTSTGSRLMCSDSPRAELKELKKLVAMRRVRPRGAVYETPAQGIYWFRVKTLLGSLSTMCMPTSSRKVAEGVQDARWARAWRRKQHPAARREHAPAARPTKAVTPPVPDTPA